jgi:hypothetical protein
MVHATVEDVIASFPHPILPKVQGVPYYLTIHSISKMLRANARCIESHLVGSALGHLGIIVSIATYATVAPAHPWENPEPPVGGAHHSQWGYRGCTTSGTSSLGGVCGYLQNLDKHGASIAKINYHDI